MTTPKRIYLVRDKYNGDETLVNAPTAAQALRHVTVDQFEVVVASQSQLVALLTEGAVVEEAGGRAAPVDQAEEPREHEERPA